jgi:flagellar basal-body rod protein FlgF
MARTDALDTIANNLANSSTSGFRGTKNSFSSVLAGSGHELNSVLNEDTNAYGMLGDTHLDMKAGSLQSTGNTLDVGIDGTAFLAVQTANGTAYTRNGSLRLSAKGQLMTSTGDAILGTGGVITIPHGATVTISSDGTISADGTIAGKLKLVDFTASANPQSMGGGYYSVAAKDTTAATTSDVRQGMLENSNVNPVSTVIELIDAQRAAESMRHALTMIDSQIDKTAVTDLARVTT